MKRSELITVAIPYHRNPDYLRQALDSVHRQTMLPAEVVVVDNSGSDIALPATVRHVKSPGNSGLAAYFSQCLDAAQTPWCTVMHADDIMFPGYIEAMDGAARNHPEASGIFCKTRSVNEAGREIFFFRDWFKNFLWPRGGSHVALKGETGLRTLLTGNFIMCPTMCYHVRLLGEERFDPRWKFALDIDFNSRILLRGGTLVGLKKTLYCYRRHHGATSAAKDCEMIRETQQCVDDICTTALAQGWHCKTMLGQCIRLAHRVAHHMKAW